MRADAQALAPVKGVGCERASSRIWRALPSLILLPFLATLLSCHKTTTTAQPIQIVVAPTNATLNIGMSTQFGVAVIGGTNNTATWSVNGVPGGTTTCNTDFGCITVNGSTAPTISPTGATVQLTTYTAPTSLPANPAVTITATSTDNSAVSTSVTLTLLPPATVTVTPPASVGVTPGTQIPFSATVIPAPSSNVIWEVNGLPGGFQTVGLISNAGVYTAPPSPPPGGSVTVTAVSIADTTQSGSATVGLSYGIGSLQGPYTFTLKGKNATGTFVRAGSFVANGSGGLASGLEDVTESSVTPGFAFVGSYTMGADGRGTLVFNDGLSPSMFHTVMSSSSQMQIISYDATGTAAGQANQQVVSAFKPASLLGTYLFDFSGLDGAGKPISEIGEFVGDGQDGIHSGIEDINDNGTTSQVTFTGSYTVNSNGRGGAQFITTSGTFNYSFYIVNSGAMKFVSADASPAPGTTGQVTQQNPQGMFTQGSLNGNYAFLISGSNSSGGISTVGNFSAGGNGLLTNGVLDENNAGTATQNQSFTGTYLLDNTGTGRGTATLNALNRTYQLVFYLDGLGGAVVQETDSAITSDGVLAQQQSVPSPAGNYALNLTGMTGAVTQQFAGQLTLNSGGTVSSGTLDISSYPGTGQPSESLSGALALISGARGTLSLTPSGDHRNFVTYLVSPTKVFLLEIDAGVLADGSLLKQF